MKKRKSEADDNDPCYVAKLSCGHYVAATSADGESALKDVQEWRETCSVAPRTSPFVPGADPDCPLCGVQP